MCSKRKLLCVLGLLSVWAVLALPRGTPIALAAAQPAKPAKDLFLDVGKHPPILVPAVAIGCM